MLKDKLKSLAQSAKENQQNDCISSWENDEKIQFYISQLEETLLNEAKNGKTSLYTTFPTDKISLFAHYLKTNKKWGDLDFYYFNGGKGHKFNEVRISW